MNEEEKFDELLSSKLSERDFPFDELNWDEAESLLIQQEKRAKFTRVALTFAAGLAAGVVIMLPFILNTHSTTQNNIVSKSTGNQNIVAQNNVIPTPQSEVRTSSVNDAKETTPLPVQSAFVKKDTRTGIRSQSSTISPVAKTSKQREPLLAANINEPSHTHKIVANSNVIASTEKKSAYAQNINQDQANSTQEVANTSSQVTNNPIVENATPSNNITKPEKNIAANPIASDQNNTSNTVAANNSPAVTNTKIPVATATNKNQSDNSAVPKPKADSAVTGLPPMLRTNPPPPPSDDHSSNILSVYAGGNYSFGWNDKGVKQGNGITPWGGFNFTHYFGNKLSVALGFGFSELNHLDQTYTSSLIQYDFGANVATTSISPQTVYYVDLPLKLQYTLGNKNIFGLGINYLLLMTTYSTLSTYQQTYFSETPGTSEKQLGYTQGFSNSDMQFTLSYTRMVTGRIGMGAEYYYDNNYLENNTVSGINQNAKNSGLRVFLTFQLVK